MFKPVKAKNVKEYIKAVPEDRKKDFKFLHEFIQKVVPNLKVHFAHNMVGYGSFDYVNYKKDKVKWPIIALANQKNYMSVYVCAIEDRKYVAEKFKKDLGKVSVGKSCIRFNKLEKVSLPTLKKVIQKAAKNPGLIDTHGFHPWVSIFHNLLHFTKDIHSGRSNALGN